MHDANVPSDRHCCAPWVPSVHAHGSLEPGTHVGTLPVEPELPPLEEELLLDDESELPLEVELLPEDEEPLEVDELLLEADELVLEADELLLEADELLLEADELLLLDVPIVPLLDDDALELEAVGVGPVHTHWLNVPLAEQCCAPERPSAHAHAALAPGTHFDETSTVGLPHATTKTAAMSKSRVRIQIQKKRRRWIVIRSAEPREARSLHAVAPFLLAGTTPMVTLGPRSG